MRNRIDENAFCSTTYISPPGPVYFDGRRCSDRRWKIHFVGAIVEDSCDISTHPQKVVFDCPAKGAKRVRHSIALADIHGAQRHNTLPATLKLHYLDTRKKLAVLSVSYR